MQTTTGETLTARLSRGARLRRAHLVFVGAVLAALAAVLIPAAQLRFIDGDEGFYLMAARLVSDGKRLYADFFFPQMPLVPEVWGGWFALFGPGWRAGRLLAALCAVGSGLLLATEVRRRTESWFWGAVAVALFLASGFVLGWFTLVKTYSLASLLLIGGVVVVQRPGLRAAALGGLLLALASGTRLYLAVALPCAGLYLLREEGPLRARLRRLLALGGGALVACLPLVPILIRDARSFYFGNVVFHALRDAGAMKLAGQLGQKWSLLQTVLPVRGMEGTSSVQFLGLLIPAVAAALSPHTSRNRLATYVWVALLVASLLPTPSYPQYFCLLIPFLILEAIAFLAATPLSRSWPLLAPACIAYVGLGLYDGNRYLRSAVQVPGVMTTDRISRWSIATVDRVAALIDEQDQRRGLTWWPGYFVATRTAIVPELANDFGMVVADKLSAAERRRYKLVTHAEVGQWIELRREPLVVAGNWAAGESNKLPQSGYKMVTRHENVALWVVGQPGKPVRAP
jgi:hypothetical protein